MSKNAFGFLALAIALAGCSEIAVRPQPSCDLMTAEVCSGAAEAQLRSGALAVAYTFKPEDARVIPFVVPLFRQDGALAAEVDCYVNTDSHSYSIIRSALAIPPESEQSVDFLRERHLCAEEGSYAQDGRSRVQTASALPPFSR
jgi:hypothetical protein